MSVIRRVLLVAAIAALAVVPLRAFGVVGAEAPSALSVSASLGGCGVAGEGIVCQIDVSFTGVEGADYYTASVTRADGSVQDLGTVGSGEGGGSASVSVPYVGAGNYGVTVSAWGSPDDDEGDKPELLDREQTGTSKRQHTGEAKAEPAGEDPTEAGPGAAPAAEPAEPAEPAAEPAQPEPVEPPTQTLPQCRPDPTAAAPEAPMEDGESPEAEPQAAPAPAPVVECTTPSADSNGPCCPPGA